jgi:hypothetical protein
MSHKYFIENFSTFTRILLFFQGVILKDNIFLTRLHRFIKFVSTILCKDLLELDCVGINILDI